MTSRKAPIRHAAFAALAAALAVLGTADDAPQYAPAASRPAILLTDLRYEIDDIDDHFDVAFFLRAPEFRKLGIVLDGHRNPNGEKVLERMFALSDRSIPYAKGLTDYLMSRPDDRAVANPTQGGVDLVVEALRKSAEPVHIIAVGSLSDIAVAYNREPDLMLEKTAAVYVVAGWLDPQYAFWRYFREPGGPPDDVLKKLKDLPNIAPNVALDPLSFVRIMRSGLPIVWAPTDVNQWMFPAPKLLKDTADPLIQFALDELRYWNVRYAAAPWWSMDGATVPDRYFFYHRGCKMYSTPALLLAAGLKPSENPDLLTVKTAAASFDERGSLTQIDYDAEQANLRVITAINGSAMDQHLARRLR